MPINAPPEMHANAMQANAIGLMIYPYCEATKTIRFALSYWRDEPFFLLKFSTAKT